METSCTGSNRDMILQVLHQETGERILCHAAPTFSVSAGEYTLHRDGRLTAVQDARRVFPILASLGLCDHPYAPQPPCPEEIVYPMEGHTGRSLLNLFSILSSRQILLNQALGAPKTFTVSVPLMDRLLAHPPLSTDEFLQALYRRDGEYTGIRIDRAGILWTGFRRCRQEESHIHRQLADRIMHAALNLHWVKPYTRNVRNRKYAFRIWLNAIGMTGPEYEESRRILLGRLYGQSDRRRIP